jgi:hypothetical protein
MPEFTRFLDRFRHDLGRSCSVAHQQATAMPGHIYVLVRRRNTPETLCITMQTRWIAALDMATTSAQTRVEYKHLITLVERFLDDPTGLPVPSITWPGTQESREALRRALDPRQLKRS